MAISDLTGTKWLWNNTIAEIDTGGTLYQFALDFASNETDYHSWQYAGGVSSGIFVMQIRYSTSISVAGTRVYRSNSGGWQDDNYKTIDITGGTDATNATLISFIEANATQIIPIPGDVEIRYNNSVIASLSSSGTEILETNGKLCVDDIVVQYSKEVYNGVSDEMGYKVTVKLTNPDNPENMRAIQYYSATQLAWDPNDFEFIDYITDPNGSFDVTLTPDRPCLVLWNNSDNANMYYAYGYFNNVRVDLDQTIYISSAYYAVFKPTERGTLVLDGVGD